LLKDRKDEIPPNHPALSVIARAFAVLLGAMSQADKELAEAEVHLREAQKLHAPLDRALAARYGDLVTQLAAADRDIETHRKRVQSHWTHFQSPRVSSRPEASRAARLKLENLMTLAAAAWHDRETKRVRMEAARRRRQRLTTAAQALSRRLIDLGKLRQQVEQFRQSLLHPLDGRRPEIRLDKPQDWPKPIRASMALLNEKVELPKPSRPPRHWGLKDRVMRFVSGGSP
jgi:hypothetical protein